MLHKYYKLIIKLAVLSTTINIYWSRTEFATAQESDLATEAWNILQDVTDESNLQSTPQSEQSSTLDSNFKVGIDNLNGNSINLCISGCIPNLPQETQPHPDPVSPTHLPIHFERL